MPRPVGCPCDLNGRELFDQVAVDVMSDVESRWPEELAAVELAVEDIPLLPRTWVAPRVPLASLVPAAATAPPRLVLFRRPIEHRAETRADLEALVLTVVVEQLADSSACPPRRSTPTTSREARSVQTARFFSLRRSRSDSPPQMPKRSSFSRAYSRQSWRTSQVRQTFFASRVEPPFSGKKASGSV